jgi:hypothetical protein
VIPNRVNAAKAPDDVGLDDGTPVAVDRDLAQDLHPLARLEPLLLLGDQTGKETFNVFFVFFNACILQYYLSKQWDDYL